MQEAAARNAREAAQAVARRNAEHAAAQATAAALRKQVWRYPMAQAGVR